MILTVAFVSFPILISLGRLSSKSASNTPQCHEIFASCALCNSNLTTCLRAILDTSDFRVLLPQLKTHLALSAFSIVLSTTHISQLPDPLVLTEYSVLTCLRLPTRMWQWHVWIRSPMQ